MNKKGQAAMEFLMTYGWAILVVLAAIGALAYFGVLSPSKHLPESCIFGQGISCVDFTVEQTTASLYLQIGFGQEIDFYNITLNDCNTVVVDRRLGNMDNLLVEFTNCDNGVAGDKFKEDTVISYSLAGSPLIKQHEGAIIANIR